MRKVRFLIFILFIVACQNRGIYEESKNKVASSSKGAVSTAHPLATKSAVKIAETIFFLNYFFTVKLLLEFFRKTVLSSSEMLPNKISSKSLKTFFKIFWNKFILKKKEVSNLFF